MKEIGEEEDLVIGKVRDGGDRAGEAQWSGTAENRDVSTEPFARPFAPLLAPLTRSLTPRCSLRLHAPLLSLVRSLAHLTHSRARGKVYNLMSQNHLVLNHSG